MDHDAPTMIKCLALMAVPMFPNPEAMIHLAMTDLMARRLTGESTISWREPRTRINA